MGNGIDGDEWARGLECSDLDMQGRCPRSSRGVHDRDQDDNGQGVGEAMRRPALAAVRRRICFEASTRAVSFWHVEQFAYGHLGNTPATRSIPLPPRPCWPAEQVEIEPVAGGNCISIPWRTTPPAPLESGVDLTTAAPTRGGG